MRIILLSIAALLLTACQSTPITMNPVTQEAGLFEFDYANTHELKVQDHIYYLESLCDGSVDFHIFEKEDAHQIPDGYRCTDDICYYELTPQSNVTNLQLHVEVEPPSYEFLTRAETLEWILELRYPETDFSQHADDCFPDVSASHALSGYVCYAKEAGTVVGIGGQFYPESSINLWGLLKILFVTFEEDDLSAPVVDPALFELMTEHHLAYPLISKAYYEGLIVHPQGTDLWPNRNVYREEAAEIIARFQAWQNGQTFKNYRAKNSFSHELGVLTRDPNRDFDFDPSKKNEVEETRDYRFLDQELYVLMGGGVYEYFTTLEEPVEDILELQVDFNPQRLRGAITLYMDNGDQHFYELDIREDEFAYLAENTSSTLANSTLLPNEVEAPELNLTRIDLHLAEDDFESIFTDRTAATRYPAWLIMTYPDGHTEERSILMKTRGNASRGYIKSSFTIESFTDFDEHDDYAWDDFLKNADEFKLRSHISDETLIKEKLFYRAFEELGYLAPDFFEVMVTVNGVPMGLYQPTEGITQDFFEDRDVDVGDYYYATNITSDYLTNLSYQGDEQTTLDHYKLGGDPDELMRVIYQLDADNAALLDEFNNQNVFDYALLAYAFNAYDSLTHNFYLYDNEGQWELFFWDMDTGMDEFPEFTKDGFFAWATSTEGWYNNLIQFTFRHMSQDEKDAAFADFMQRWESVDMLMWLDEYVAEYGDAFAYDNALWNGKYLERKLTSYDTLELIEELRAKIVQIQNSMEASSNP